MRSTYFGTDRDNVMSAGSEIRESFYGLAGNDVFYFYGIDGVDPDYDVSDRFFGGTGRDRLENITLNFDGLAGLDQLARLSFDGGKGYDTLAVAVTVDMTDYSAKASDLDLTGVAPLLRSVEHREFDIELSAIGNTPEDLAIIGGDLDETVFLHQTASMRVDGVIRVNLGGGDDRFEYSADIGVDSSLIVDTGKGADVVLMNASSSSYPNDFDAVIRTRGGADTIVLDGMYSETANAGAGNDTIYVLSGSFAEAPDVIRTGNGNDKVYLELDSYSKLARINDFSAEKDVIIFDAEEVRDTEVTFDKSIWSAAEEDKLYMDNAVGKLYFGDNVLVSFGGETALTADNFLVDDWAF
ncbi:hypothetical protein [Antarcticimicrobium sediminis]|uniref:Hemolysin-type calcium-binding repeat-containing protein n=1 Tax=Antarcticimicrobium sediminis TaxID=2546227 RepID=A0A4R5EUC8_9RHOB|nr:hypothetical protein [Antarcticimicrobium sediminis]TDE38464.1 hypothetical protein E1B25_10125 [Antarcticimicrobium sediminis]